MIRVLIVDDHGLVRTALKRLLDDAMGIEVVGEAASGEDAIILVREKSPDVVLMDVKMPGIGGLEATRKLLRVDPDVKILAVTSCNEEPFPSRLLQAGAMGYLTKGCEPKEVEEGIHAVFKGKRHISPEIAQSLALKHLDDTNLSPFEALSERELQVMIMITNGQKVPEIAKKLHVSPKTVNSYRYRLFDKLGVETDVELTHLAIRHGLTETSEVLLNVGNEKNDNKKSSKKVKEPPSSD